MSSPTEPEEAPSRAIRIVLWPVRAVVVIVIVPVQLTGDAVEEAGLVVWRTLDPVTAPVRRVLLAVGRAVATGWRAATAAATALRRAARWVADTVVGPPLRWLNREILAPPVGALRQIALSSAAAARSTRR